MNKLLLRKIGFALLFGIIAGILSGILAYYTGIRLLGPLGAAAGAAYGWLRGA